jgi:hypothetical protein
MEPLFWGLGAVSLMGLFLGFAFRAPVLVVASGIVAVAICATCAVVGLSVAFTVLITMCGLFAMQSSYLLGLCIVACARRAYSRDRSHRHGASAKISSAKKLESAGHPIEEGRRI